MQIMKGDKSAIWAYALDREFSVLHFSIMGKYERISFISTIISECFRVDKRVVHLVKQITETFGIKDVFFDQEDQYDPNNFEAQRQYVNYLVDFYAQPDRRFTFKVLDH